MTLDDASTPAVVVPPAHDDPPAEPPTRHAAPNWWHRDHPVFTSLMGFFTGSVVIVLVPGLYGFVLSKMFDDDKAASLFPFVTLVLALPLALIAFAHTRRFGRYLLFGMVLTAVVVLGVAALTLWFLISHDQ